MVFIVCMVQPLVSKIYTIKLGRSPWNRAQCLAPFHFLLNWLINLLCQQTFIFLFWILIISTQQIWHFFLYIGKLHTHPVILKLMTSPSTLLQREEVPFGLNLNGMRDFAYLYIYYYKNKSYYSWSWGSGAWKKKKKKPGTYSWNHWSSTACSFSPGITNKLARNGQSIEMRVG